jgi:hypothetical protein
MADPDDQLRRLLGAEPPGAVLELDVPARTALAALLQDSRQRQTRSLEESFGATLKHVPFPLRKIVKRVLLG